MRVETNWNCWLQITLWNIYSGVTPHSHTSGLVLCSFPPQLKLSSILRIILNNLEMEIQLQQFSTSFVMLSLFYLNVWHLAMLSLQHNCLHCSETQHQLYCKSALTFSHLLGCTPCGNVPYIYFFWLICRMPVISSCYLCGIKRRRINIMTFYSPSLFSKKTPDVLWHSNDKLSFLVHWRVQCHCLLTQILIYFWQPCFTSTTLITFCWKSNLQELWEVEIINFQIVNTCIYGEWKLFITQLWYLIDHMKQKNQKVVKKCCKVTMQC